MNKIAFAFDLHDTIVNASKAWIAGYQEEMPDENGVKDKKDCISVLLREKVSRSLISRAFNLDHTAVELAYRRNLNTNINVISLVQALKSAGFKIILISNARRKRAMDDIKFLELEKLFFRIYTQENGLKPDFDYVDSIIRENELDLLIMIGNSQEDIFHHPRVLNLQLFN